jgi:proteasome component ECM29
LFVWLELFNLAPDTNVKLRLSGMSFVQWIARMAEKKVLDPVAPILLSGLLKFLKEPAETQSENLRGFGYVSVGLLAQRCKFLLIKGPELFENDLSLLKEFVASFSLEEKNICVSIQEALSSMMGAYKISVIKKESADQIIALLNEAILMHDGNARYVAVKYARGLFPFCSVEARFICMLAASDSKLEIREEAINGLEFIDGQKIPVFDEMISYFNEMTKKIPRNFSNIPSVRWIDNVTVDTLGISISFFRQLLMKTLSPSYEPCSLHNLKDEKLRWISNKTRTDVQTGLKTVWQSEGLKGLLSWLDKVLSSKDASTIGLILGYLLHSISSFSLLEILSLGPSELSAIYARKIDWLLVCLILI